MSGAGAAVAGACRRVVALPGGSPSTTTIRLQARVWSRSAHSSRRIHTRSRTTISNPLLTSSSTTVTRQPLEDLRAFHALVTKNAPLFSMSESTSRSMSTSVGNESEESDAIGPLEEYNDLIASGSLKDDAFQRTIIETLQELHDRLRKYTPEPIVEGGAKPVEENTGLFSKFSNMFNRKEQERLAKETEEARLAAIPKGLYLYGSVGTGKTMLMDLFYKSLPRSDKKRIHFHNFMLQLHGRLHQLKSTTHQHKDPVPLLADQLATESRVLCLDEFQVTDIADAMLLRRLLEELVVNRGVVLVTTSNRHPSELYKNGIQRESFLPGIAVLEDHCVVQCLDGGIDYRREKKTFFHSARPADQNKRAAAAAAGALSESPKIVKKPDTDSLVEENRFFWPLAAETKRDVQAYFDSIRNGTPVHEMRMSFLGRELVLPQTAGDIAMCSFDDLCAKTLSAADYLHLASNVKTLILTDIPKLKPTTLHRNETRRLITLIDALYECEVKLVCSADGPISEIFGGGSGAHSTDEDPSTMGQLTPAQRQMMDDLGLNDISQVKKSPIFSGEEEKFAVQRAESRLIEMQGAGWGL